MSKTRHRLLAIMALLLAMLTVMPSAMADMRGINVSGRAVSERHVHRRLRLRRRQGHAGHRLHQRVHDQPGQLRAAAGQEPRLLPLPGGGNATAEADYFVNTVRPYIGTAVLVLDWEGYQNAAWGNSNWVRVFVNRVHARTGVWPLVYTSAAYLYQIPADVRSHCGLWVAQYANNNATGYQTRPWNYGRYGEAMRQYTSNGRIPGYAGPFGSELLPRYHRAVEQVRQPQRRILHSNSNTATVRSGDTISGIAARTGLWPVSAWSVPSGNVNLIYPGNVVTYRGAGSGNGIHHGRPHAYRQERGDAERDLRRFRLAACRSAQRSYQPEPDLSRSAAPLLTITQLWSRHRVGAFRQSTYLEGTLMDISAATTLAAGIVALVAPALIQTFKKYIPADYVGLTSLGVSVLLGVITIAATNGFHGYGWGIVLTGVIGVAQAVYTLVNQAFSGKLRKDETQA